MQMALVDDVRSIKRRRRQSVANPLYSIEEVLKADGWAGLYLVRLRQAVGATVLRL